MIETDDVGSLERDYGVEGGFGKKLKKAFKKVAKVPQKAFKAVAKAPQKMIRYAGSTLGEVSTVLRENPELISAAGSFAGGMFGTSALGGMLGGGLRLSGAQDGSVWGGFQNSLPPDQRGMGNPLTLDGPSVEEPSPAAKPGIPPMVWMAAAGVGILLLARK